MLHPVACRTALYVVVPCGACVKCCWGAAAKGPHAPVDAGPWPPLTLPLSPPCAARHPSRWQRVLSSNPAPFASPTSDCHHSSVGLGAAAVPRGPAFREHHLLNGQCVWWRQSDATSPTCVWLHPLAPAPATPLPRSALQCGQGDLLACWLPLLLSCRHHPCTTTLHCRPC